MLVITLCRSGVFIDVMVRVVPASTSASATLGPRARSCGQSCPRIFLLGIDRRPRSRSIDASSLVSRELDFKGGQSVMSAAASTTTTCHSATSHRVAATRRLTLRRWLDKEKMERNGTTRWMVLIHWMILIHWTTGRLVDREVI